MFPFAAPEFVAYVIIATAKLSVEVNVEHVSAHRALPIMQPAARLGEVGYLQQLLDGEVMGVRLVRRNSCVYLRVSLTLPAAPTLNLTLARTLTTRAGPELPGQRDRHDPAALRLPTATPRHGRHPRT